MNNFIEISKIVRFHRIKAGLNQKQLADMAGVGKTVIFDMEKGKETIQFKTLRLVLNALNIKIELQSKLMDEYLNNHA